MKSSDLSPYHHSIALRTTELHPHLDGTRVFVVGSTGFYGSWLLDHFRYLQRLGLKLEVHGGSRRTGFDAMNIASFPDQLRKADWVINCAGPASNDADVHALGGIRICGQMRCGSTLLHFSSGAVARGSLTQYALSKQVGEFWLQQRTPEVNVQIVRPFATVGPGMGLDKPFAVSAFMKAALARTPLQVTSRPINRSFCHITDLVVQCLHVMVHGDGRPYEVGSDHGITIEQAARLISDDVRINDGPFPSNADQDVYIANLSRLRERHSLSVDMDSIAAIMDTWRTYSGSQVQTCHSHHSTGESLTSATDMGFRTLAAA